MPQFLSPKVDKTLLFTGFRSRHDFRFFENAQIPVCFAFIKAKKLFKKCKKYCNLQGFGTVTGKKLRKYQRFSVQKWPKHRYLQCFVPSTFSWHSKSCPNTNIFCDQLAKNAVIYSVFVVLPSITVVFAAFCASLVSEKCGKTALFFRF